MHELESGYDGYRHGPVVRRDNTHLSNSELVSKINERIAARKPVGRLLSEYENRS